jgi:hypothetical protein
MPPERTLEGRVAAIGGLLGHKFHALSREPMISPMERCRSHR